MKCDEMIVRYLLLDNGEKLSARMRLHLLFCKGCQREIASIEASFAKVKALEPPIDERDISDAVLMIVRNSLPLYTKKVSMEKWILAELIIIASIMLIHFSTAKAWLDERLGGYFHLLLNAAMGVIVTVYNAVLAMTHLDEFNRVRKRIMEYFR
ncbi:MAG: hypothetical protein N2316_01170 [Spirochaetes bacterium]|nr:hypothetical protein [Spirochaetota bacterium]